MYEQQAPFKQVRTPSLEVGDGRFHTVATIDEDQSKGRFPVSARNL
jgi:hypothetical protein